MQQRLRNRGRQNVDDSEEDEIQDTGAVAIGGAGRMTAAE